MDLSLKLARMEGKRAVLWFEDGEQSEVRVISVDLFDHEEITYELHRVIVPGPAHYRAHHYGLYVAPLASIADVLQSADD